MDRKVKKLVVDTAAFVKNVPLWELAEEFYCVADVIREIKDRQTRHFIDALPLQLQFREPSAPSVKFINEFTKKTGDYSSLSLVDVKVLALTYELEIEFKGTSHLRAEPLKQRTEQIASVKPPQSSLLNDIEGFYNPSLKSYQPTKSSQISLLTINSERNEKGIIASQEIEEELYQEAISDKERKGKYQIFFCEENEEFGKDSAVAAVGEEEIKQFTISNYKNENFSITLEHLHSLDHHLVTNSYVNGCCMTVSDKRLFIDLRKQYPLLQDVYDCMEPYKIYGSWDMYQSLCSNYSLKLQSEPCPNGQSNQELDNWEPKSFCAAREFSQKFGTWRHFVRWFLHMVTFSDAELELFEAIGQNILMKEIFNNISNLNNKNQSEPTLETSLEEVLTGKLHKLEVFDQHPNTEAGQDFTCDSETPTVEIDEVKKSQPDVGENKYEADTTDEVGEIKTDEGYEEWTDEEMEEYDSNYESDDEDDDEGWITPSNLKQIQSINRNIDEVLPENAQVACITADYAMQNTLKHIGLHVMGVNGKLVKTLKTFILRCYACYKTTDKMDQLFCKYCGHKTLKRVSVTLNPDGSQQIWISSKKPINIRGTKFSLPRPRGGKHAINPILVADQREAQQRVSRLSRSKTDPLHEDYDSRTGGAPFVTRDVYSRSAQLGLKSGKKQHRGVLYWEQKNPNVPLKKGTRRKKR